ncbi:PIG-L family deacetylase [Micromonospora sp. CPCC 205539]|uniref:PIG-L deacetylase family protein n=1 Tax=Micromonospora sp. CPCC 205539 TaxID=3122408 RepID=UPI002FF310D1
MSPHLDDAVFSVGGALAALSDAGWRVQVVTCFTATVADPSPFALSTQLDKGLPADADYMALRRAEDHAACAVLGAEPIHLPFPEAPHRGYRSAPELFAGVRTDDGIGAALRAALRQSVAAADVVLAPQALGGHTDHRIVAETVADLTDAALWWRDVPYVRRAPHEEPWRIVPRGRDLAFPIGAQLARKIEAVRCYTTQLGFQFGGSAEVARVLRELAGAEALRSGVVGQVEPLRCPRDDVASRLPVTVSVSSPRGGF